MAYTGRAPSAAPLTSADINDGAVAPADLSTGAPSWDTSGNLTVGGGNVILGDNDKAIFGAGSDLQIYHDGSKSIINDAGTGNLEMQVGGSTKLATTSTGIDVTGTVTADGLTVDGTTSAIYVDVDTSGADTDIFKITTDVGAVYRVRTDSSLASPDWKIQTGGSEDILMYPGGVQAARFEGSGDISFYEDTGTTAKFFWDASAESLGIGTSSPQQPLHITGANPQIRLQSTDTSGTARLDFKMAQNPSVDWGYVLVDDSTNSFEIGGVNGIKFNSISGGTSTERMRIDSSGNLLVGTSSLLVAGRRLSVKSSTNAPCGELNRIGTPGPILVFYDDGQESGYISVNGTTTAYNTSSDYRLKEDWQPMSGSIDRLKALNPVNFAWISSGERVDGFLAHEAAEVVPEAVTGEKDAVEAIGNITDVEGTVVQENVTEPAELAEGQTWTKTEDRPVYQGIDQSKLTPLLTAALQDTIKLVEDLQAEVAALKAQLNG